MFIKKTKTSNLDPGLLSRIKEIFISTKCSYQQQKKNNNFKLGIQDFSLLIRNILRYTPLCPADRRIQSTPSLTGDTRALVYPKFMQILLLVCLASPPFDLLLLC